MGLDGHVLVSYADLVTAFGDPNSTCLDDHALWRVVIDRRNIEIYCLKKYVHCIPTGSYPWHIGAESLEDVNLVGTKLGRPFWRSGDLYSPNRESRRQVEYAHNVSLGGTKSFELFFWACSERQYDDILF
ncbi:hypothetical protein JKP88DRAFT_246139 [Tribonema minus]|uniref:Uncharacterized protein n=1 Tax=Tribonema minus TaxID=303371 RepID=A0A835YUD7_9STRA|nr:hypothetical protein JKP88DRAFT_246139 [Tribonema minus]